MPDRTIVLVVASLLAGLANPAAMPGEDRGPKFLEGRAPYGYPPDRGPVFTANVTLVLLPVTVLDAQGRVVNGLEREHFTILEEKKAQQIVSFSSEDTPCSVGLLFDTSGSMRDKISKARLAARAFFDTTGLGDEAFLMTFADRPELRAGFTSDFGSLQDRLPWVEPGGSTALVDAVYLALRQMHFARQARKALLIISDGGDNHSRYSEKELKALAAEIDVQIYAVGIHDQPRMQEEMNGTFLLENLARLTGGLHFVIRDVNELNDIVAKIGLALHNQYVLGFYPENHGLGGKRRRIEVKVAPPRGSPPMRACAPSGYWAPDQ